VGNLRRSELLRVHDRARTELTQLDQLQPEEIERKHAVDSAADQADVTDWRGSASVSSGPTTASCRKRRLIPTGRFQRQHDLTLQSIRVQFVAHFAPRRLLLMRLLPSPSRILKRSTDWSKCPHCAEAAVRLVPKADSRELSSCSCRICRRCRQETDGEFDLGAPLAASDPAFQTSYRRELFPTGVSTFWQRSIVL